jgi:hypothetical protein
MKCPYCLSELPEDGDKDENGNPEACGCLPSENVRLSKELKEAKNKLAEVTDKLYSVSQNLEYFGDRKDTSLGLLKDDLKASGLRLLCWITDNLEA